MAERNLSNIDKTQMIESFRQRLLGDYGFKEEQIGMPSHSDNSIIMGNSGNGYARITLVSIDE